MEFPQVTSGIVIPVSFVVSFVSLGAMASVACSARLGELTNVPPEGWATDAEAPPLWRQTNYFDKRQAKRLSLHFVLTGRSAAW
ncbi:MAG: hypothetical protein HY231_15520 [Acidobacteria bacterium]|nr:hypothetical protein [Acidobacteriota bacterium]